jgi:hypothetical protein
MPFRARTGSGDAARAGATGKLRQKEMIKRNTQNFFTITLLLLSQSLSDAPTVIFLALKHSGRFTQT